MHAVAADAVTRLATLVRSGDVLVLTGAGMSTGSGIPDYRGPDGTLRHHAPMTYQQFVASAAARQRYWARSHLGWGRVAVAAPNAAHHGVTALQRGGLLTGVVTQNVDGLHTAAGTAGVIDLHGTLRDVVCLRCGDRRPRFEIALRLDAVNPGWRDAWRRDDLTSRPDGDVAIPEHALEAFRVVDCRRCGGLLKPDVVFFGESVPRERFGRALALADRAGSLLVLGSSLTVGSGYRFVTTAARRGIPVAIVNRGATRGDRHATVKVDAGLADVLDTLRSHVLTATARAPHRRGANPPPVSRGRFH